MWLGNAQAGTAASVVYCRLRRGASGRNYAMLGLFNLAPPRLFLEEIQALDGHQIFDPRH